MMSHNALADSSLTHEVCAPFPSHKAKWAANWVLNRPFTQHPTASWLINLHHAAVPQSRKRQNNPDHRETLLSLNAPVLPDPGEELFSSLLDEDDRTPPDVFSDLSTVLLSIDLVEEEHEEEGEEGEQQS